MSSNNSLEDKLEGRLHLFSETGTEGGSWAFQDSCYIQENVPNGYCKNWTLFLNRQIKIGVVLSS